MERHVRLIVGARMIVRNIKAFFLNGQVPGLRWLLLLLLHEAVLLESVGRIILTVILLAVFAGASLALNHILVLTSFILSVIVRSLEVTLLSRIGGVFGAESGPTLVVRDAERLLCGGSEGLEVVVERFLA